MYIFSSYFAGLGDNIKRDRPVPISKLSNIGACKVTAEHLHTALLTVDGRVYIWGKNSHHQVTKDNNNDQSSPRLFVSTDTSDRMLDVACTKHSSVLMTTSFKICYIGRNADGIFTLYEKKDLYDCLSSENNRKVAFLLKTDTYALFNNEQFLNTSIIDYLTSEQANLEAMLLMHSTILKQLQRINHETSLFETLCRYYAELMYFNAANVESLMLYFTNKLSFHCDILMFKQIDEFLYSYKSYLTTLYDFVSMGGGSEINQLLDIPQSVYKQLDIKRDKSSEQNAIINDVLMQPFHKMSDYKNMSMKLSQSDRLSNVDEKSLKEVNGKWQTFLEEEKQKEIVAKRTSSFWLNSGKVVKHLKMPKRRLIRDSHQHPLFLLNASRFSSHWFILFNDKFVHVNGSTPTVHDLTTVWVEPQQEDEEANTNQYQLLLKMPEDNLTVYTQSPNEKMEWLHDLQATINLVLGKQIFQQSPPVIRHSSYTFKTRSGVLKDAKYTGRWLHAKMFGSGKMEWSDGKVYNGQFSNNQFHGFGRMKIPGTGTAFSCIYF